MNWAVIGAIGDFVGAIAVVSTLGFLLFQVRQNTIALRRQSARESTSSLQQVSITMMNPDVAGTISRVYSETDPELSAAESAQLEHWMLSYLFVLQQDYLEYQQGLHLTEIWESRIPVIKSIFVSIWVRKWWRTIGYTFVTAEFQKVIEQIMTEEARDGGDYWKQFHDSTSKAIKSDIEK